MGANKFLEDPRRATNVPLLQASSKDIGKDFDFPTPIVGSEHCHQGSHRPSTNYLAQVQTMPGTRSDDISRDNHPSIPGRTVPVAICMKVEVLICHEEKQDKMWDIGI